MKIKLFFFSLFFIVQCLLSRYSCRHTAQLENQSVMGGTGQFGPPKQACMVMASHTLIFQARGKVGSQDMEEAGEA